MLGFLQINICHFCFRWDTQIILETHFQVAYTTQSAGENGFNKDRKMSITIIHTLFPRSRVYAVSHRAARLAREREVPGAFLYQLSQVMSFGSFCNDERGRPAASLLKIISHSGVIQTRKIVSLCLRMYFIFRRERERAGKWCIIRAGSEKVQKKVCVFFLVKAVERSVLC